MLRSASSMPTTRCGSTRMFLRSWRYRTPDRCREYVQGLLPELRRRAVQLSAGAAVLWSRLHPAGAAEDVPVDGQHHLLDFSCEVISPRGYPHCPAINPFFLMVYGW